jgi:hypothetical protein
MTDPEIKLNSLTRFSKKSPRLVLEEYSSCEVPAGCGGVVLRWRSPSEAIPMTLRLYCGNCKRELVALDGVNTGSKSKIPVGFGRHTFALALRDVQPEFACVLLSATLDSEYVRVLRPTGDTDLVSAPDGSWRYSLDIPGDDSWQQVDFDDSAWKSMVEKPFGPLPTSYGSSISTWTRDMTEQGARGLGVATEISLMGRITALFGSTPPLLTVYVRKTFRILRTGEV